MSTPNFNFKNRIIVVTDGDYENDNYPSIDTDERFDDDRNYPRYRLKEYQEQFFTIDITMNSAYYQGACIDYEVKDLEDEASQILYDNSMLSNDTLTELKNDIIDYFMGCKYMTKSAISKIWNREKDTKDLEDRGLLVLQCILEDIATLEEVGANNILDTIKKDYGYQELGLTGVFSNGEAIYHEKKVA